MSNEISLVQANYDRALLIAEVLSNRVDIPSNWTGFRKEEGLEGELRQDNVIVYMRPGHVSGEEYAAITFIDPILSEINEVDWGEAITIETDVIERYADIIKNATDASYDENVSHTFSKTKSLEEGFKLGAELAIKTTAGVEYSGVKAGVEVSAKLSAEYNRQWGEETTTTDVITRQLHVPAHTNIEFEAVRSVDKQQRHIKAQCNFNYTIQFVSAPGSPPAVFYKWNSVDEFIAVAKGFASRQKDGYDLFIDYPLSEDTINKIKQPSPKTVEWIVDYDNVQSQRINII